MRARLVQVLRDNPADSVLPDVVGRDVVGMLFPFVPVWPRPEDELPLVKTIGVLEILGAAGLILPPLTGIAPGLAIAAATGLALIQVGGIALHLSRGEARLIGLNIVLLAAAVAAAWLGATWL
jgi:hypothetical protein